MKNVDLTKIHYLSGPFEIDTAEPGDVLLVEIMDVQPFEDSPWGLSVLSSHIHSLLLIWIQHRFVESEV